jgi:hypothetical protein
MAASLSPEKRQLLHERHQQAGVLAAATRSERGAAAAAWLLMVSP